MTLDSVRLLILTVGFVASAFGAPFSAYAQVDSKVSRPASLAASKVKGLLYEIQVPATNTKSRDQKKVGKIYLFGSIHVAKADFYPMSAAVMNAYKGSDTVVVEADVSNTEASGEIVDKLSYVAPDKLESHLTPATWEVLKAMTGASSEQFQRYKPVMVAMGLTISVGQRLGFEPAQGIDLHFIQKSRQDKKELIELEGVSFQGSVLADLTDAEGEALLASTLETFRKGEAANELNRIADSWKKADVSALSKILRDAANRDAGSQMLMKRLMDDRNPIMLEKIAKMVADGKKLFIVIGAGHLAGENSILELMQKQSWNVKQIR